MNRLILTIVLLNGLLLYFSCSEEVTPTPFLFTEKFTGKTFKAWDLDKITVKEKGKNNQTFQYTGCSGDDRYIFYANEERLYEVRNGRTACDPNQSGIEEEDLLVSYSWEYNIGTSSLSMIMPHVFGYFIIPLTVTQITSNTMVLEIPFNDDNTTGYIFEFRAVNDI